MHGHWAPDAPSQISFSRLACLNTHPEKLYEQKWEVGGGGNKREPLISPPGTKSLLQWLP